MNYSMTHQAATDTKPAHNRVYFPEFKTICELDLSTVVTHAYMMSIYNALAAKTK